MTRARVNADNVTADITGITAGVGITGGGTSGTVTVTNSLLTTIDAKGDLLVGTTADTAVNLTVGSNNTFLVADSAQTSGLKWASSLPVVIDEKTTSYTLVLTDAGKCIDMNTSSANTLTIPLNSSVEFPIGTMILIIQSGAGQTTVAATVGVTLRAAESKIKLKAQYAGGTLLKEDTNTWYLFGNTSV